MPVVKRVTVMELQKSRPIISVHKVLYKVSKWLAYIGMSMSVLMMLMVVVDVLMRFAFNRPLLGSVEVASYMLSIIAFTAIPFVESEEGHIVIPIVFDRFPQRIRVVVNTFVNTIGLIILVIVGWASFLLAREYIGRGRTTQVLNIPIYPFVYIAAVCMSLYVIIMIVNTVKYIYQNR